MNISKSELAVMSVIWAKQPCTSQQIVDALNENDAWHEKTVKTLINRLLKKGAINYQKEGRQYWYSAVISQQAYQKHESSNLVSQLFEGKVSSLVATFAEQDKLSPDDIDELKQIIASWEDKA